MVPPGGGPAPHVHERTGETFYVINGELEFLDCDKRAWSEVTRQSCARSSSRPMAS
jgi:mannose-6-phosphate isomerase-like protein (cupin superfamily)